MRLETEKQGAETEGARLKKVNEKTPAGKILDSKNVFSRREKVWIMERS